MDNVIFLSFNKKINFPPGKWLIEPDFCKWTSCNLTCLVLRDMSLGIWKGWVGLPKEHLFFNKTIDLILDYDNVLDLFFSVHGGISMAGPLPYKRSQDYNNLWWIGIETCHGDDYLPLAHLDPELSYLAQNQSYKDFSFIRKEIKKLAKFLSQIK